LTLTKTNLKVNLTKRSRLKLTLVEASTVEGEASRHKLINLSLSFVK